MIIRLSQIIEITDKIYVSNYDSMTRVNSLCFKIQGCGDMMFNLTRTEAQQIMQSTHERINYLPNIQYVFVKRKRCCWPAKDVAVLEGAYPDFHIKLTSLRLIEYYNRTSTKREVNRLPTVSCFNMYNTDSG